MKMVFLKVGGKCSNIIMDQCKKVTMLAIDLVSWLALNCMCMDVHCPGWPGLPRCGGWGGSDQLPISQTAGQQNIIMVAIDILMILVAGIVIVLLMATGYNINVLFFSKVLGSVPTISVDKTDGCQMFLRFHNLLKPSFQYIKRLSQSDGSNLHDPPETLFTSYVCVALIPCTSTS